VIGDREPGQPPLGCEHRQQRLHGPTRRSGQSLQVQIRAPGCCGSVGAVHPADATSTAVRTGPKMSSARAYSSKCRRFGAVGSQVAAQHGQREVSSCCSPSERCCSRYPSLGLEIGPPPVTRKVDRLSCVRLASAGYSVPTWLIGTTVRLVPAGGRLLVAEPTGEVVDDHAPWPRPGSPAGWTNTTTPPARTRPKTATEKQFCALGPAADALLVGAAAIRNTRLASRKS